MRAILTGAEGAEVVSGVDTGALLNEMNAALEELRVAEHGLRDQNQRLSELERALEAERERYRELFEHAPDAYFVTDALGRLHDANLAAGELLGVPPEHLPGRPLAAFVATEDQHRFFALVRQLDHTPRVVDRELRLQPRGRDPVPVAVTVSAIDREGGRMRWLARDIADRKRAEEALRESEEEFRTAFELAADGILQADPAGGRVLRANRRVCEITGYTAEQLRDLTFPQITHPDDREESLALFRRMVAGEVPDLTAETRIVRPDGTVVWVSVHAAVVRDAAGSPVRAVAIVRDVTGRRRAEARSRIFSKAGEVLGTSLDDRENLRSMAAVAVPELADACAVALLGSSGGLEVVEAAAADPGGEVSLRGLLAAYPGSAGVLSGALADVLEDGASRLLPEVVPGDADPAALRELGATSLMVVPLVAAGRTVGAVSLVLTGSGRRYGPEELAVAEELARRVALAVDNGRLYAESRESQERTARLHRFTAALSGAPTPDQVAEVILREGLDAARASSGLLAVLEPDGRELRVVRAAGFAGADSLAGLRIPCDGPSPLALCVRSGESVLVESEAEARRSFPEPEPAPVRRGAFAVVPLSVHDHSGGALLLGFPEWRRFSAPEGECLVSLGRECARALERALLFEREQRARAQAETAIRTRDEVLGVVAHDLRNPLSAIAMYAHLLRDPSSEEQQRQHLRTIEDLTMRMNTLIQDLLDVSRIDAGQLRVEADRVEVELILREVRKLLEHCAADRGVEMRVVVDEDVPPVWADAHRALQVFSNLVGNAVKFTPAGGRITVRAARGDGVVVFSVSDTGPGIRPEDLERLFDRFWQARSMRRGGVGLGLAIARGIVQAHGGEMRVESRVGEGTTFTFTLPVAPPVEPDGTDETAAPALPAAPRREESRPAEGPPPGRTRLLLVDDHPTFLLGVRDFLRKAPDLEVIGEAASGEEAVEKARVLRPDVVVMDLALPGLSGIEATRRIAAIHPAAAVLALTSDTEEECLLPVLGAGGSGYVRKTSAPQDLVDAIRIVARGEVFLYPSSVELLLRGYREARRRPGGPSGELTEQERQLLRLVAEGYTAREIGKQLFLAPTTVESYRSQLMRKLGLNHRSDLVQFALRTGLLAPGRRAPGPGRTSPGQGSPPAG